MTHYFDNVNANRFAANISSVSIAVDSNDCSLEMYSTKDFGHDLNQTRFQTGNIKLIEFQTFKKRIDIIQESVNNKQNTQHSLRTTN